MNEVANKSLVAKIFSIFWEPSSTFKALKNITKWYDVVLPLVLISIVTLISLPYITPIAIEEQKERIIESEKIPEEQKDMILERMEEQSGTFIAYITTPITIAIQYAIIALVMMFAGNFILGGQIKYLPLFAMSAYSGLIDIISTAVKTPLMVSQQTIQVYTSMAIFFEESQTFLFRFMSTLDVFAFWKVILLSIGLGVICGKRTKTTFTVVLILWLLYCVIIAAISGVTGLAGV
jgi:hypothetical protein